MRNFTLAVVAAAMMAATGANAQSENTKALLPASTKAMYARLAKSLRIFKPSASAMSKARAKRAAEASIWKAQHDVEYDYDDGNWEKSADNTYTYNKSGQALTQVQLAYGEYAKLENTYDDKGQVTNQTMSLSTDGVNYTPYAVREQTYDDRTGYVTKYSSKIYDSDEGSWSDASGCNYSVIERNADGAIVKLSKYTIDSSTGDYAESERLEMTYANGGTAPTGMKIYGVDEETNKLSLAEELKDMVWVKSDGQITSYSFLDLVSENNVLKSATIPSSDADMLVDVTSNDKGEFTAKITISGNPSVYQTESLKYTDQNGSYRYGIDVYSVYLGQETLAVTDYITETYDDNGNSTMQEEWASPDYFEDAELVSGVKHAYKYDGPHGEMTEDIESDNDGEGYEPYVKVVYDTFVDVATAIKGVADGSADAPATYYNLQGMKVDNADKGLYIMKRGGKVVKIMK